MSDPDTCTLPPLPWRAGNDGARPEAQLVDAEGNVIALTLPTPDGEEDNALFAIVASVNAVARPEDGVGDVWRRADIASAALAVLGSPRFHSLTRSLGGGAWRVQLRRDARRGAGGGGALAAGALSEVNAR